MLPSPRDKSRSGRGGGWSWLLCHDITALFSTKVHESSNARFIMQKQPDGSWKIAGCYLIKTDQLDI